MALIGYICLLFLIVVGAYSSGSDLFHTCYSRYGLEDNRKLPFYAERCQSTKKAVTCFEQGLSTLGSWEKYLGQDMLENIKKLAAQACAFARVTYCPANYLDDKMKSCAKHYDVTSMTNMTPYYAKIHYWSLRSSLSCMETAVKVCPDADQLQSYINGIREWRTQLDILRDSYRDTTGVHLTTLKTFYHYSAGTKISRGMILIHPACHFSTFYLLNIVHHDELS